jgi:thioredoxin-related protein
MLTRRTVLGISLALASAKDAFSAAGSVEPVRLEDGRYTQSWFLNSFLVLGEDLAETTARGKRFAIMWDQRGCPYCMELHKVNLADPAVNNFIRERFDILQLDMAGSREVTDFDGQVLAEKDMARKYGRPAARPRSRACRAISSRRISTRCSPTSPSAPMRPRRFRNM